MNRDEFYLRKLAHFLGEGLDLAGARDMAALATAIQVDGVADFRPLTSADAQADYDRYREEQR